MYNFLATVTDSNGKRLTRSVVASSAVDAVQQLKAEGCTDIELHDDDASAVSSSGQSGKVTPKEMIELRSMTTSGFFLFLLGKLLRSSWGIYVAATAYVLWAVFSGNLNVVLLLIAIAVLAVPLITAAYFTFFTPSRKFFQLMDACAWGRWDSVLELVRGLRGHAPEFELDVREAIALAKMGQVEAGLSRIDQHANRVDLPKWMYFARRAEFYAAVERYDLAIENFRHAHANALDNPTVELDFAMALLKNNTDLQTAESLIASAQRKPLSDMLKMYLPYIQGLQRLNSGAFDLAQASFSDAQRKLSPLAASQPLIRLTIDIISAYLVIAAAKNGDYATCKAHYHQAKKRLKAMGYQKLLAKLNEAARKFL